MDTSAKNDPMKVGEGNNICPMCKGIGRVVTKVMKRSRKTGICPKCKGEGKIDWVSNIMGVKK